MPWYNFLTKNKSEKKKEPEDKKGRTLTIQEFVNELGLARSGVIGAYSEEENPDNLKPENYIAMQGNDGQVQAIVRLLSLPIQATPISIVPGSGDKGERDFIETIFNGPEFMGGMTTPLPFIIADMTRAIFEGFRLYEKVAHIIKDGPYKGKIGWRKLAPRDATTVALLSDDRGGFDGAHQQCTFGETTVNVNIPKEKCVLFTFQKEKHWLYGESILKAAYYHYDKKHKLYYIAHKKAEIEALGLKILKINQNLSSAERSAAEDVVDTIGVNSRITLPQGLELEIDRSTGGFDVMPLVDHHNNQMSISALTQIMSQVKYAYPYGGGTEQSKYLGLSLHAIMRQMEATLNTYAIAPLIDWNFATGSYPQIKLQDLTDEVQMLLSKVFDQIMKRKEIPISDDFVEEVTKKIGRKMNLEWSKNKKNKKVSKNAVDSFEKGKIEMANSLNIPAPSTNKKIRLKISKKAIQLKDHPKVMELFEAMGRDYTLKQISEDKENAKIIEKEKKQALIKKKEVVNSLNIIQKDKDYLRKIKNEIDDVL